MSGIVDVDYAHLPEVNRDISRLEAIVQAAERRRAEEERRAGTADHLLLQIRRLDRARRELRRRMRRVVEDGAGPEWEGDEEALCEALSLKERAVLDKLAKLRRARAASPAMQAERIRRASHAMLHRRLLQAIELMRAMPDADERLFHRYRRRAAELVRLRRERAMVVAALLKGARNRLVIFSRLAADPEISRRELEPKLFDELASCAEEWTQSRDLLERLSTEWPEFGTVLGRVRLPDDPVEELRDLLRDFGFSAMEDAGDVERGLVEPARRLALWMDSAAAAIERMPAPPLELDDVI